jgi:hypothetical protein
MRPRLRMNPPGRWCQPSPIQPIQPSRIQPKPMRIRAASGKRAPPSDFFPSGSTDPRNIACERRAGSFSFIRATRCGGVMTQTENLVKRIPNDIGGLPAERIEHVDYQLEPWEKRCHALADVLDFHKIINTEEKRCAPVRRRRRRSIPTETAGELRRGDVLIAFVELRRVRRLASVPRLLSSSTRIRSGSVAPCGTRYWRKPRSSARSSSACRSSRRRALPRRPGERRRARDRS